MILRNEAPKKDPFKSSYAELLNSLIKVNQERVTALTKLYVLNSITYCKDVLRSTIENKLDGYDKMQERLIRTLRHTLDNLKLAPKVSIDENDLNEILQDHDKIFVFPTENSIDKEQETNKVENVLRNKYSDDENSSTEQANEKSDSDDKNDDSKSTSLEKLNEESLNEVKGDGTQGSSYYGCGRGRLRCIKACKEAYRETCAYFRCSRSFRSSLKMACKMECLMWFY
nr:uncharacterized protein LOC117993920 isoform X1 [Maniola hyperantus]